MSSRIARTGRALGALMLLQSSALAQPLPAAASASAPTGRERRTAALHATLRDQHGRPGGFQQVRGHAAAVFVVSAARLKRLRDWEAGLRRSFADLRVLRVADVPPSDPAARYDEVAERLRAHVPPEVSVLIDVERVWATGFEIDSREVTVLVFDAQGRLEGQLAGSPTPERLARAVGLIAPLAGKASPAPGARP